MGLLVAWRVLHWLQNLNLRPGMAALKIEGVSQWQVLKWQGLELLEDQVLSTGLDMMIVIHFVILKFEVEEWEVVW